MELIITETFAVSKGEQNGVKCGIHFENKEGDDERNTENVAVLGVTYAFALFHKGIFILLSVSIDIGYLVATLRHKATVWQAAFGGGISDDDRSVYPFIFFHAEPGQITDYLGLLA